MALEGTLADMSLSDLFQIFQSSKKSGVLTMNHGVKHGIVYVYAGRLIDASVYHTNEPLHTCEGEAAIICLLQWAQADFIFAYDITVAERHVVIQHSSSWLILEALRQQKSRQIASQSITLQTCVEPVATAASTEIGMALDLDQWRILDRVSARSSLEKLANDTRIAPPMLVQLVTELVATGLLHVVVPDISPSKAQSPYATTAQEGLPMPVKKPARVGSLLLQAIQRRVRAL
jgi:hypothetical protein